SPTTRRPPQMAVTCRSTALLRASLLLCVVALTVPTVSGLTFYVPREKPTHEQDYANMELEKAVKEMLAKMDSVEVDNIKSFCEISSDKLPIPAHQKSLIVMCQTLGYKPLIAHPKPKRSLEQLLRANHWLRPTRH
ncbi:hypothetical protein PMAYCL1PPCAC_19993, partial [Pristionchus mayeri]